jgi:hypothetical protein
MSFILEDYRQPGYCTQPGLNGRILSLACKKSINQWFLFFMRKLLFIIPIFLLFSCEKSQKPVMDFQNLSYNKLSLYVYKVTIHDGSNNFFHIDTLGLFCSDKKFRDGTQKLSQWEVLTYRHGKYTMDDRTYDKTLVGIDLNDTELYFHPPRFAYFRLLQFCPHPLFYIGSVGSKWSWNLAIGTFWATPPFFPITNVDTFKNEYEVTNIVIRQTAYGDLPCFQINAYNSSPYGRSTAIYYLNTKYGVMNFQLRPLRNIKFVFDLVQIITNRDTLAFNRDFLFYVDHNHNIENANLKYILYGTDTIN